MNLSDKSDEAESRKSLGYHDDSDDGQSLLSNDGAEDIMSRETKNSRKKTRWGRMLASLGFGRTMENLPYYELQQRGQETHPRTRPRNRICSCVRYLIVLVFTFDLYPTNTKIGL